MRIKCAAAVVVFSVVAAVAAADTLSTVRQTGQFTVGFREDARPFSYRGADGEPAGYSVDLCRAIAEGVRAATGRTDMKVEFVPVPAGERLQMVKSGAVDIECGSTTHTLDRQREVSFTLSTFVTGAEMALKSDSPIAEFKDLAGRTVGVLQGTTTEAGLRDTLKREGIEATVRTVSEHTEGLGLLRDGTIDAYFADRILLFGLLRQAEDRDAFKLSGQFYSYEPYAIMLRRGDDDMKLVADTALAEIYRSGEVWNIYARHFPEAQPSELLIALYILQGIPVR
jgi:polar amino acid transport system substrate-binding protein